MEDVIPDKGVYAPPSLDVDAFGRAFLAEVETLLGTPLLKVQAPRTVRVSGWRQRDPQWIVVHWVNYNRDEGASVEVPIPTSEIEVALQVPEGVRGASVEWIYPEADDPRNLSYQQGEDVVRFQLPRIIVYGITVLRW